MKIDLVKRYMCFPIKCGAQESKTRFVLPEFNAIISLELTSETPDFYVYFDALYHKGGSIELLHEDDDDKLQAKDLFILSDVPLDASSLYIEPNRPLYHFTNVRGWINDPNGMIFRDGEYHMFYQLNSFGSRWYDKGWGHAKSKNLFDWEILPPGLYADDSGYAISGSALFDPENRAGFGKNAWILAYSTRVGEKRELGQTIDIAYSIDGKIFHKYDGNPVITDNSTIHLRDPKVFWHEPTQKFVMVITAGIELRFYNSPDLKAWSLTGVLDSESIDFKDMIFECPELMEYTVENGHDKRWILQVSIMHRVLNIVGDYNGLVFTRDPAIPLQWADYGKDFYAAVGYNPFGDMDNRHVWIGWMSFWKYAHFTPKLEGWMGMFTVPRELSLQKHEDGLLYVHQKPVREITQLYEEVLPTPSAVTVHAKSQAKLGDSVAYDLQLNLTIPSSGRCGIDLNYISGEHLRVSVDGVKHEITVDRTTCALPELGDLFLETLSMPLPETASVDLHLLTDKGGIELYALDGQMCMAVLCYPKQHTHTTVLWNESDEEVYANDIVKHALRRAKWKF